MCRHPSLTQTLTAAETSDFRMAVRHHFPRLVFGKKCVEICGLAGGGLGILLDHGRFESRRRVAVDDAKRDRRSEEHTSELQSLMRSSYAVFCLKKKNDYHK